MGPNDKWMRVLPPWLLKSAKLVALDTHAQSVAARRVIPAALSPESIGSLRSSVAVCGLSILNGKISVAKPAIMRRDEVSPFRDKLWDLFTKQASGMDGADVVLALRQAGEEIWSVGIDDTYSSMKHQDDEALGNAFDITWLTIVCIKLKEIKAGKKPRVRAKGHGKRAHK
jgi:hypothetical protein